MSTRTVWIRRLAALGLLCAAGLVWPISEFRDARAVRPPVDRLRPFLDARLAASIRRFDQNGQTYVCVVGKMPQSLLTVRSGPPAYVFDSTGVLVDWAGELGEASAFERRWPQRDRGQTITESEARQLVR